MIVFYNHEDLALDPDVKRACEAELKRRKDVAALAEKIQQRDAQLKAERQVLMSTWNGIDEPPKELAAITSRTIELETLRQLLEVQRCKEKENLAGIAAAKIKFFEKRLAWFAGELAALEKAIAPHLAALKKLTGVDYEMPDAYRGIYPGDPRWEGVPRPHQLQVFKRQAEERIDQLRNRHDVESEKGFFVEWCDVRKHSLEGLQ